MVLSQHMNWNLLAFLPAFSKKKKNKIKAKILKAFKILK